jgi:hypothetical protein
MVVVDGAWDVDRSMSEAWDGEDGWMDGMGWGCSSDVLTLSVAQPITWHQLNSWPLCPVHARSRPHLRTTRWFGLVHFRHHPYIYLLHSRRWIPPPHQQ